MKRSDIALLLAMGGVLSGWLAAEEAGPSWARQWDARSRQIYLSSPDSDWDGLNDAEEQIGKALWGAAAGDASNWCEGVGASNIAEWTWCGIDDDVQPVPLPFPFPWGTQSWSRIWICVNGTLGFDRGQSSPQARPLPDALAGPYPFYGVFWQQLYLDPAAGGRVWVCEPGPQRFVVCWENLQLSNEVNSRLSFQAELNGNGTMIWRYRELNNGAGTTPPAVVGMQRDGLGWWQQGGTLGTPLALRMTSFESLSPDDPDSDGDGIPDGVEFYYYDPDRPAGLRLDPAVADNPGDIDRDGLDVISEFLNGPLDPFHWDSDGDMLGDGYEVATRLRADDATGRQGWSGDADSDGVPNWVERLNRTQPRLVDSDGDGLRDRFEMALRSNPAGAGTAATATWMAPVRFTLGDPGLDGATEAYAMRIDPVSGDTRAFTFQNSAYGGVQTQTIQLVVGAHYRLTVNHLGSLPGGSGEADPDYEAGVAGVDGTVLAATDSTGLLGRHDSTTGVPFGTAPIDTNRQVAIWIQSRVLPDGSTAAVDPLLIPLMDIWSAGRSATAQPVAAAELNNPGVLVLPAYAAVMGSVLPTKIRAHGLGTLAGGTRWLHFSIPGRVSYWWSGMSGPVVPSATEVQITGDATRDVDIEVRANTTWPIGTTVQVSYVIRNSAGQAVAVQSGARLIGQVIAAVGDSLTYGLRRRHDGTYEMPQWYKPWLSYPSLSSWNGYPGTWYDIAYHGFRGYLRRDLTTAVPWAGHPANSHGPDHCGYPGAWTTEISSTLADTTRTYPLAAVQAGPSALVLVYFIGLNDVIGDRTAASIYANWQQALNNILAKRSGRGRTLVIGVTLPVMRSDYSSYTLKRQAQLTAMNRMIRAHTLSSPFTRYVVADPEDVPHDSNDDGLHFLAAGYEQINQIIRQAILNGMM